MPKNPNSRSSNPSGFHIREIPEAPASPESGWHAIDAETATFEQLGELPRSYGDDIIYLIAQEPHWLFSYWDIDISHHPGGPTYLRCHLESSGIEDEIEVPFETRNWYIPVQRAGASYFVEMGYYRTGKWHPIARSVTVQTPPEGMAAAEDFDFATIPFHLSFQRLVTNLESTLRSGQQLMSAVAHMQRKGDFTAFSISELPAFTGTVPMVLLENLLGSNFLDELASGGLSSGDIENRIRAYLEERLHSEGASEMLVSIKELTSLSSFFQASGAPASAVENFTSWTAGSISSWAAGAFSSWLQAASSSMSVESASGSPALSGITSWGELKRIVAASSWGQETSWSVAETGSWARAAASSWLQSAIASWSAAAGGESSQAAIIMSSWLQASQSSWAQAALSSWSAGAMNSSWAEAGASSWGSSEATSSFGTPVSAKPSGILADVTFHGDVDPEATLRVGGKTVSITPDGTFRCQVTLDGEDCEVPIVATRPDGVEIHRATLKLTH